MRYIRKNRCVWKVLILLCALVMVASSVAMCSQGNAEKRMGDPPFLSTEDVDTCSIRVTIDNVPICTAPENDLNPSIAMKDGNTYAVWQRDSDIHFARLTDLEETWECHEPIGKGYAPSIAVDQNGYIYVVWGSAGTIYISNSTDSGSVFSTPVKVGNGYYPDLAVDSTGYLYIWSGRIKSDRQNTHRLTLQNQKIRELPGALRRSGQQPRTITPLPKWQSVQAEIAFMLCGSALHHLANISGFTSPDQRMEGLHSAKGKIPLVSHVMENITRT